MRQYVIRDRGAGNYIAAYPTLTEATAKVAEYIDTCGDVIMSKVKEVKKHA